MTNRIKQLFKDDPDMWFVVAGIAAIALIAVLVPLHGHFQMLELFGSCGCPL